MAGRRKRNDEPTVAELVGLDTDGSEVEASDGVDGYDEADGIYDFMSRQMMPFSVDVDHSARTEDSGPGYYRWTKKGWTWTPGDDAVEAVDHARLDAREWVKESALPEAEKLAILEII